MTRDRREDPPNHAVSRREAFKVAAAITAASLLPRDAGADQRQPVAEDGGTLERAWREGPASRGISHTKPLRRDARSCSTPLPLRDAKNS